MFMRFPIDACSSAARRRTTPGDRSCPCSATCVRGPGSCRSSGARTGYWSSRSARSRRRDCRRGSGPPQRVRAGPLSRGRAPARSCRRHKRSARVIELRAGARRATPWISRCPANCVGCGREGPPLCDACVPALDRRLEAPGRRPDRAARRPARPAPAARVVRTVRGRSARRSTRSSTAASSGWPNRSVRRSRGAGHGSAWARTSSPTCRSTPRGPGARLRPGGAHRDGPPRDTSGCRTPRCSRASAPRSPSSTSIGATARPTSPARSWSRPRRSARPADLAVDGSCSSTTS